MVREWETRPDYQVAVQNEDILRLWYSLEMILRRVGAEKH